MTVENVEIHEDVIWLHVNLLAGVPLFFYLCLFTVFFPFFLWLINDYADTLSDYCLSRVQDQSISQ